jgi:tryptophanyl-tRNA synthetase
MQRASLSTAASAAKETLPRVIFSGIQPTGVPHLGNYVGALRQWASLQRSEPADSRLFYSIVDLHAITVPQDPVQLRAWRRESLAALLAIGIDPKRSTLFFQSSVRPRSVLVPLNWHCLQPLRYMFPR